MKRILIFSFLLITISSFGQKEKGNDTITIPNVITPNSETNYIFQPTGIKSDWEMIIFNRWGEMIFEGKNKGWQGTFNNQPAPTDVYIYKLVYWKENEKVSLTGHLSLIR